MANVLGGAAAVKRQERTIASGVAWSRLQGRLAPSATINTNGAALTIGPDASAGYLVPTDLALKSTGVSGETLTVTATYTFSDSSTQSASTTFTTNLVKQFLPSDAISGRGIVGAGGLPLVQASYAVQSSIANSVARVAVDAVFMEKSFDV